MDPWTITFREPELDYDGLVEAVTLNWRVVPLPAISAAIGRRMEGPGSTNAEDRTERFWLCPGVGVFAVLARGRERSRRFWAQARAGTSEAEAWFEQKLATVLERVRHPGQNVYYAMYPDLVDKDIAALDELERVAVAALPVHSRATDEIDRRIHGAKAEVARLKSIRGRFTLMSGEGGGFEDEGIVPSAPVAHDGSEAGREAAALWQGYRDWIRAGAARSRDAFPVHRPTADTGLSDERAVALMTAACSGERVIPGRAYPGELPAELAPWYVYVEGLGHCVAVAVETPHGDDPWQYMTVATIRVVRREGWKIEDGVIVCPVPGTYYANGGIFWEFDEDRDLDL